MGVPPEEVDTRKQTDNELSVPLLVSVLVRFS